MRNTIRTATLATCLGMVVLSSTAMAERKNPLEGQPAIRHRYEMRKGRFELGPSFGFSLNRSLRQAITFGAKLEYHLNDWLSFGADFGYGINMNTGLTSELKDQCGSGCIGPSGDPAKHDDTRPWDEHKKHFSDLRLAGDIRGTFTPIAGKMGVFSKLFVGYDLYVFAGLGMGLLANSYEGNDKDRDGVSQGFRLGPAFGFGAHFYFTHWMSMGLEVKDLIFPDNESGGDHTRGMSDGELQANVIRVDGDDSKFVQHWLVGINFTFFLPAKAEMSK